MAILAIDSFQRANENPLSNGGNWTTVTSENANQIVSDVCEGSTASARNSSFFSGIAWPNDQYAEITLAGAPGNSAAVGVIARCAAAAETYFYALMTNNGAGNFALTLNHRLAGSSHATGTVNGFSPVAGDVLRIQAIGTTISAWYNGVQQISVTDANIASGSAGLYNQPSSTLSGAQISRWDGGNFLPQPAPQVTTLSSTIETVIIDGAPGMNNALIGLVITVAGSSPAAGTLTLRDSSGGTIREVIDYPMTNAAPSTPYVMFLPYDRPLYQSAPGQSWTIQASNVTTQTYHVTAFYREG